MVADVSEILNEVYLINLNQSQTYTYIQDELNGLQRDLVGYIFGWAQAVREDYNAGTLSPSGQRARIEQGIWGALGFSAGGMKFH